MTAEPSTLHRCPHCGGFLPAADPVEDMTASLRSHCRDAGITVYPGDRVSEAAAASLLGMARGTLENRRLAGTGPTVTRFGIRGSRWAYSLRALAEFQIR
ncbi:MAG: hypothetical protein K0U79_15140 [Gammaproteobacteria bacterium]|nr:hypothetical protein [Gammaproteobacteria bacterium]